MNCNVIRLLWVSIMVTASIAGNEPGNDLKYLPTDYRVQVDHEEIVPVEIPLEIPVVQDVEGEEYDFIIVGSGSAGSVIANRLSEIGSWKILLLEAGNPENNVARYPALADILVFTEYNWGYTTEPQPNFCLAMNKQRCVWPRGRALGGSTVINTMVYQRGNPNDYDRWAAHGNPGWSYADVLPYFLKSENARLNASNPHFHHEGGYLSVQSPYVSQWADVFIQAGNQLGYNNVDYNSPQQIGFGVTQATTRSGRRVSTASAFLSPILSRRNLRIVTGARVTKILIDSTTKRACGVQYLKNDRKLTAGVRKEVIVSAGVVGSPQLLMLSGVGPKEHLAKLGIETLSDLPVGQTLYDQIRYVGLVINVNMSVNAPNVLDPALLELWQTKGSGLLGSIGFEGLAFINTGVSDQSNGVPDAELLFIPVSALPSDNGALLRRVVGISDYYYRLMFAPLEGQTSITILPVLLHPKSRGCIELRSADFSDPPLIFGNYLTDPDQSDAKTLIAAIRFTLRLLETPAFRRCNATLNPTPIVGCESLDFNSNEYWYCALQFLATTNDHQTSTCKMGAKDDPTAVVNNKLKVYGIRNLRVADASIIPFPLSGHTSAPAIMIGEMASDLIKRDWKALKYRKVEAVCTITNYEVLTNQYNKCGVRSKLDSEINHA